MSHPTSPLTIPHTEIQPLPTEVMVLVAPTANKHMHHLQSTTRCGGTPLPNGKIQQNNGNNPSLHGITELLEKHKKGTISSLPSHKQSTLQSIPEAHCLQLTDHTVLQHWLSPTCAIHQLHTQQVSQTPHTRDSMKAISRHLHPTTTHNPPGTSIPTAPVDNNEPSLAPLNNSHPLKSNSHPNLAPTNSCCNALPNPTHEWQLSSKQPFLSMHPLDFPIDPNSSTPLDQHLPMMPLGPIIDPNHQSNATNMTPLLTPSFHLCNYPQCANDQIPPILPTASADEWLNQKKND